MRRQLIVGAAAITITVVIAFVVPLGLAVRALAANRPVAAAQQTAQSVATVFALTDDEDLTTDAVVSAQAGSEAVLTVYRRDGSTVGASVARSGHVDRAFAGASFAADVGDDRHVFVPAVRADGTVAVVRAVVPSDLLWRGVVQSWLVLAALGLGLIALAVTVADRLGRTVVRPTMALADTARRVARGDLDARVQPAGPAEVAEVGRALNTLASRISGLLATEREMVAQLSHRLRTPLTALRLDADAVTDPGERARLRSDVDAVEATVTELIREARAPSRQRAAVTTDLVPVVRDRAQYWGALADEQQRDWTVDIEADAAPARMDAAEAEALLDVLLDNVFTHTPEGTGYRIRVTRDRLVVEDDGPGIAVGRPDDDRDDAPRSTGLGLDIARQTAERAGGRLEISTHPGGGGRVSVVFGRDA